MHNLAVAVESFAGVLDIALVSSGVESLACASLLAASGQRVQLRGSNRQQPTSLRSERPGSTPSLHAQVVQFAPVPRESDGYVRSPDVVILHGKAEDYNESLYSVARDMRPGQTIFVIDAPLFTAFEISRHLQETNQRLAVNVIETGPLFSTSWLENGIIHVGGISAQTPICGRTLNETRAGLSIGRQFWNGLVPASNVFERALSSSSRLLGAAQRLFALMGSQNAKVSDLKGQPSFSDAQQSIISAMECELHNLGRQFNISVPKSQKAERLSTSPARHQQELALVIKQDLVLITELAKLAYLPVPTIDSIIELASVTLGQELRRESRGLANLGLIGMDFGEIVELINA